METIMKYKKNGHLHQVYPEQEKLVFCLVRLLIITILVTGHKTAWALTAGEQLLTSQLEESDAVIKGKLIDFKIIPLADIYKTDRKTAQEIQGFSWYELRVKPILGQTKKSKRSLPTKPIDELILEVGVASMGNKKLMDFPMKSGENLLLFLRNHSTHWTLENHLLDIYTLHEESEELFIVPKLLEVNNKLSKTKSSTGLTKNEFQILMARYVTNYSPNKIFGKVLVTTPKDLAPGRGVASEDSVKMALAYQESSLLALLESPSAFKRDEEKDLYPGDVIPQDWAKVMNGEGKERRGPSSAKERYEQLTGVEPDQENISIYFLLGLLGLLSVFGNIFVRFFFPEKD